MANTAAKKLTYDSKPVQVESAIRDGTGMVIRDTYLTGFITRFAGNWSGGVHPVNCVTVDYSTCNSENGVFIKFTMACSHGNGQAFRYLEDVILNVKYDGTVAGNLYRYFAETIVVAGDYNGMKYGDVFWTVDTTNKIVKFYVLMGQYAYSRMTTYFRLNQSTGGTITQSSGQNSAYEYSSGTKNWASIEDFSTISDKYVKPSTGIPKTDLASAVQTSLGKADTASQTDENVKQTIDTSNVNYPLIFSPSNTTNTGGVYKTTGVTINPSSSSLNATNINTSNNVVAGDLKIGGNRHSSSALTGVLCISGSASGGWVRWRTNSEFTSDLGLATLASPALTGTPTAPTATAGTNTTQIATTAFVKTAIDELPEPMLFKGTLGTGGTITSLPTASASNEGWVYKVITDGTYASQAAKIGDLFICANTSTTSTPSYAWTYVPSGDDTGSSGVTNVATGVGLTGGPITTSGMIKAKLKSETNATYDSNTVTNTSGRQYAVVPDKTNGYLSVNVPWTDSTYSDVAQGSDNSEYPLTVFPDDDSTHTSATTLLEYTRAVTTNLSTGTITASHFYNSTTSSSLDFIVGSAFQLTEVD